MEILIPKPGSWYTNQLIPNTIGRLAGPFHDDGDPWQRIKLPKEDLNTFQQGHRLMDETSVFHQKIGGSIYVIPGLTKAKFLYVDGSSGYSIYEIKMQQRFNGRYSNTTIQSSLELVLTGSESRGKIENGLIHAHFTTHLGTRTIISNHVHTFENGTWGDRWTTNPYAFTLKNITTDQYGYSEERLWPASINEANRVPGALTIGSGMALAKQSAIRRDSSLTYLTYGYKLFLPETDLSMSYIRSWINRLLSPELFDSLPSLNLQSYGELTHQATKNLDLLSSNMLEFILELRNIKSLVPKLKNLGKISTHAGNYLGAKYGILPTISDLKSIFDAFKANRYYDQHGFTRVSAYDSVDSFTELLGHQVPVYHTRRIHLSVNEMDSGLDSLVEKARNIGVFPSLSNLWDIVPLSFVFDWFVDLGSVLERIDTHHRLFNLDIPYVIQSDKIEANVSFSDPKVGIGVDLSVSRYSRRVTTEVPQPRIFGDVLKPPTVQNHWIEGSALILQRTKK